MRTNSRRLDATTSLARRRVALALASALLLASCARDIMRASTLPAPASSRVDWSVSTGSDSAYHLREASVTSVDDERAIVDGLRVESPSASAPRGRFAREALEHDSRVEARFENRYVFRAGWNSFATSDGFVGALTRIPEDPLDRVTSFVHGDEATLFIGTRLGVLHVITAAGVAKIDLGLPIARITTHPRGVRVRLDPGIDVVVDPRTRETWLAARLPGLVDGWASRFPPLPDASVEVIALPPLLLPPEPPRLGDRAPVAPRARDAGADPATRAEYLYVYALALRRFGESVAPPTDPPPGDPLSTLSTALSVVESFERFDDGYLAWGDDFVASYDVRGARTVELPLSAEAAPADSATQRPTPTSGAT